MNREVGIRHNNDSSTLPFGFNCCAIGLGGRVFTQPGPTPDIQVRLGKQICTQEFGCRMAAKFVSI